MKYIVTLLIFLTTIFASAESVVILNLKNVNIDKVIADAATEIFATTLAQENIFSVIERSQLEQIFNELQLTSRDEFNDDQAIQIGKLAKAHSVILGSITKLGNTISVNARLIDVSTGTIYDAKTTSTDSMDELNEVISNLAKSFNKNPDKSGTQDTSNIIIEPQTGINLKQAKLKFTNTKINIRPSRKHSVLKEISLASHLNGAQIKYLLIEFKDKTKIEIHESIYLSSGVVKKINLSKHKKPVKKIKIEAKIDRSETKLWVRSILSIYGVE